MILKQKVMQPELRQFLNMFSTCLGISLISVWIDSQLLINSENGTLFSFMSRGAKVSKEKAS